METCNDEPSIRSKLEEILLPNGFEVSPFLICWYNDQCQKQVFHLPYDDNCLAYVVISTPSMFEKSFLPFIDKMHKQKRIDLNEELLRISDPLDQCVREQMQQLQEYLSLRHNIECTFIDDYELTATRRPKILMQTVGHVSGVAYYYQRQNVAVQNQPWSENKKIYGVNIHPRYGGWFAFRSVVILKNIRCSSLKRCGPLDVVPSETGRIDLLNKFNFHWQDWTFRDVVPVSERYSRKQMTYFQTPPRERFQLLSEWIPRQSDH